MAIEKLQAIYSMYINFIQSSSSNYWIKMNFEFQNVVLQNFKFFVYV
jgi:hypothetical protein